MKAPRALIAAFLLLAAICAASAPSALGGGHAVGGRGAFGVRPAIPAPAAERVLRHAERLSAGAPGARGDMTLALLRVVHAYDSLDAVARHRADVLFARPSNPHDPEGSAWSAPEAAASPSCTPQFCVHWVARGRDAPSLRDSNGRADGDGVPDYVELTERVMTHVFAVENGRLGWRGPLSDGRKGGSHGTTDVYLADVGTSLFGYAAPDRGQQRRGQIKRSLFGYLVLDDDYKRSQFPGTKPADDLKVTAAHEYNHILQFSYDAFQDVWMAESTAVWMEDHVYDGINDYLRYMRRWTVRTRVPLTASSIKIYGSAVWNHWLERHYGAKTIRTAWARGKHLRAAGFSVASYGSAIRSAGPSDFERDFARFARDVAEWRTDRVFREGHRFPDAQRLGVLRPGAVPKLRRLGHTTFQMLRVPTSGGKALSLRASSPRGVAAGLALVGRIGSARHGRPVSSLSFRRRGGRLAVRLAHPGRFQRITAILINADTAQHGFSGQTLDWRYLHDHARFRVGARLSG